MRAFQIPAGPGDAARAEAYRAPGELPAEIRGVCYYVTDAVVVIGGDGRIRAFNKGAERIFRHRCAEVEGRRFDMLLPEEDRTAHAAHFAAFAETGPAEVVPRYMNERGRVRGLRRDGTTFPAQATIAAERIGGEVLCVAIIRDLTESAFEAG